MMMALHSTLNTATSFLEMSEYFIKLLQSIITQNGHVMTVFFMQKSMFLAGLLVRPLPHFDVL